jgi:hypothetical protein
LHSLDTLVDGCRLAELRVGCPPGRKAMMV